MVSVVIPLFNKKNYVANAVQSVLAQTFQDFEIIVVNDGSTDGSAEVVKACNDSRINLIEQTNAGVSAARNTGITASRGEWIAFLDADDIWLPNNLASHLAIINLNPHISWSAGNFLLCQGGQKKREISIPTDLIQRMDNGVAPDALELLSRGLFCTITVIVRKSIFKEIGLMDTTLKTAEDLDLWLRIALRYPRLAYCLIPIAEYRDVPESLSRSKITDPQSLAHFEFARKYLKVSRELAADRGAIVLTLCRNLVETGIKKLLLSGHTEAAVDAIREFTELIEPSTRYRLQLFAKVPGRFLHQGFLTVQTLRSLIP
jgi:glycosyltransferase involved in cell wall biosynthesis